MHRTFFRAMIIALIGMLTGTSVAFLTELETRVGLNELFQIRGSRKPPAEVVIVAMDESSENALAVGQDFTRWRSFHAELIRQLHLQGVELIVFDLQFLAADPDNDPAFADAMRLAGNVLIAECVQKFRHGVEDFFGRDECSDSHKQPAIIREGDSSVVLSEQLVAMRKISPTPLLADSSLDRAPFFLNNDAENTSILESWIFFDELAEQPSLPLLAWLHYRQRSGAPTAPNSSGKRLSAWLTEQRRACSKLKDNLQSYFDEPLSQLICQGNSRFLNYYGPPKTIRMESYSDVYQGKVADLANKVVFVGRAYRRFSPGKNDFFPTPYSDSKTGKMAGVEIMATQFANLLNDDFIDMPVPAVWLFGLFGLVTAMLLIGFGGWVGIFISFIFAVAYAAMTVWSFARFNGWLPIVTPLLIQTPLSWLLALAWSRYDLLRERKRILNFVRRVFPQWLPLLPATPGQWDQNQLVPASAEKDVNGLCLATDIEGYTAIAAHHRPREVWALLNAYYRVLGHPVTSRGGVITDVTGDAMMAVWINATVSQRRATCLAALEMEQAIASFNQTTSHEALTTRIGMHEGEFTLGSLDTEKTSHYRAIGDTVNTSSRIQGVNKFLGTNILASKAVIEGLGEIVYRPVGMFQLLGRAESIELVEIAGKLSDLTAKQAELHRQFAEGLALFQQAKWRQAARQFRHALTIDADDGPSLFYLERAAEYIHNPDLVWEGYVGLDYK